MEIHLWRWIACIALYLAISYGASFPLPLPALIFLMHALVVAQIRLRNDVDAGVALQLHREAVAITNRLHVLPADETQGRWRGVARSLFHHSMLAPTAPTALAAIIVTEKLLSMASQ